MAKIALTLPNQQFMTDDGVPVAGGYLYTFLVGTLTPQTTYSTAGGASNTNPILLDSAGRCTVYVPDSVSLKLRLEDANHVVLWTQDGVSPAELAV